MIFRSRDLRPNSGGTTAMPRSALILCAVVNLFAMPWTSGPASAHHAIQAQFDQNRLATLTGVMTRIMWINPHVRWFMDVTDEDGNVTSWNISGAGPGSFRRAGISAAMYSEPARPTRQPSPCLVTARTSVMSSRLFCPTVGRSISGISTGPNPSSARRVSTPGRNEAECQPPTVATIRRAGS